MFPTFSIFMTKLQDAFKAVNPIDSAMQKLALLWQGNWPVEEMITNFRLLVGDVRLSTYSASDQIHLIKMFMTCLNPQLKKKIIFGDIVPKTIEEWYTKAIQYNWNYRLTQAMMALDNQTPEKNTGKSWFNQNQNQKDPNAMDIGAVTSNGTVLIGALTEDMWAALMKLVLASDAERQDICLMIALWKIRANSSNKHNRRCTHWRMFTQTSEAWQPNRERNLWKCWLQIRVLLEGDCLNVSPSFCNHFECDHSRNREQINDNSNLYLNQ